MAENPIPEEWLSLGLAGVGAASKATIEDWIAKQFPTFPAAYSGMIAGFLLYKYGDRLHSYVSKFGAGVLIGSIGQLDIIKGLIPAPGGTQGSSAESSNPAPTVGDLARMEAQRSVRRGVI